MRVIHPERLTLTTSSGSASGNTSARLQGLLRQVIVKAAGNTTFDITLTNDQSQVIYERVGEVARTSEQVQLPVRGVYTVALGNASADEVFTVALVVDES